MAFFKNALTLFLLFSLFFSCENGATKKAVQGNFYTPQYANGFCIDTVNGKKMLRVFNPFQHSQQLTYSYTIDSAVRRVVCMSTTHAALLNFIGAAERIVGMASAELVYDSALHAKFANGQLANVGYDTQLNMERLLALHPDVIFAYGISGEFTSVANKLEELGLRVVYIGEYTEEHPLGKAEWAVAIASFFGCEALAVEKFTQVSDEYNRLKKLLDGVNHKTQTLLNAPWGEAWFVPGMRGNMATLLHDAGGESVVPLRNHRDSYPISIELAYRYSQHASCWINPGRASSLAELKGMHKMIKNIPAFKLGEVYNNNARTNAYGGSDFFESGTVNPHLILKDLIKILHPELLPEYQLFYYKKFPQP
jgi:iron complex transport system substrate-binding protein